MANVYLVVMDTTKDREDPQQMMFYVANYNYDLTHFVNVVAARNKSEVGKVKLFLYPTKRDWETARAAFVKRADWTRA